MFGGRLEAPWLSCVHHQAESSVIQAHLHSPLRPPQRLFFFRFGHLVFLSPRRRKDLSDNGFEGRLCVSVTTVTSEERNRRRLSGVIFLIVSVISSAAKLFLAGSAF